MCFLSLSSIIYKYLVLALALWSESGALEK